MIRVTIIDQGKSVLPRDLTSPAQLRSAVEQCRNMIVECERLLQPKPPQGGPQGGASNSGGTPYLS